MPELAEVARYALNINFFCTARLFFKIEKSPESKNIHLDAPYPEFSINAVSRGKELKLTFYDSSKTQQQSLVMGMGMSGYWHFMSRTSEELPTHTMLSFSSKDGGEMCFVDTLKYGRWRWGDWGEDRGPDPVKEFEKFVENISNALTKAVTVKSFMNTTIGDMLLNQKYFNGIGNYLRAEILHKANIHPSEKALTALLVTEKLEQGKTYQLEDFETFDFKKSIVLQYCHSVCVQVLTSKVFDLLCYRHPQATSYVDKRKRTMWYHPSQLFVNMPIGMETSPKTRTRRVVPENDDEKENIFDQTHITRHTRKRSFDRQSKPYVTKE